MSESAPIIQQGIISAIGKIIRISSSNSWIIADPFVNYKGKVKTTKGVFLLENELRIIADKQFATERLTQVREFLFCCFTDPHTPKLKS